MLLFNWFTMRNLPLLGGGRTTHSDLVKGQFLLRRMLVRHDIKIREERLMQVIMTPRWDGNDLANETGVLNIPCIGFPSPRWQLDRPCQHFDGLYFNWYSFFRHDIIFYLVGISFYLFMSIFWRLCIWSMHTYTCNPHKVIFFVLFKKFLRNFTLVLKSPQFQCPTGAHSTTISPAGQHDS